MEGGEANLQTDNFVTCCYDFNNACFVNNYGDCLYVARRELKF